MGLWERAQAQTKQAYVDKRMHRQWWCPPLHAPNGTSISGNQ